MTRDEASAALPAKDTGGCAFPNDGAWANGYPEGGMTLRDYFAAKAMAAEIITSCSDATPEACAALVSAARKAGRDPVEQIAFNAYTLADAMLAERAKGGAA